MNKLIVSIAAIVLLQAGFVSAQIITYNLSDKAYGGIYAPDYGLRLDDLFGTSSDESNWTFSFEAPGASVQMDVDTGLDTVRIHGTVFGGRDIGTEWDSDTTAFWTLDFLYDNDDLIVYDDGYWDMPELGEEPENFGWLQLIGSDLMGTGIDLDENAGSDNGKYIALGDYHGGSFEPLGGPAPAGPYVSAWLQSTDGFVEFENPLDDVQEAAFVRPNNGECCMDFGFRATQVPEPSTMLILGTGLAALGLRRRKQVVK
ncbi:MAG: hypothetical protein ACI909_002959 [Planctomycetota bacterium]|jgi:hypothetical protein